MNSRAVPRKMRVARTAYSVSGDTRPLFSGRVGAPRESPIDLPKGKDGRACQGSGVCGKIKDPRGLRPGVWELPLYQAGVAISQSRSSAKIANQKTLFIGTSSLRRRRLSRSASLFLKEVLRKDLMVAVLLPLADYGRVLYTISTGARFLLIFSCRI